MAAEATRGTALAVAAIRGAILRVAATLRQDAAAPRSPGAAGTRAGTSTPGTRGIVAAIKGGAAAVSCIRCAHHRGAIPEIANSEMTKHIISSRLAPEFNVLTATFQCSWQILS